MHVLRGFLWLAIGVRLLELCQLDSALSNYGCPDVCVCADIGAFLF